VFLDDAAAPGGPANGQGVIAAADDQPKSAVDFGRRAAADMGRKDPSKAVDDLTQAIALDPNEADYYARRGEARIALNQKSLAIADFDAALRRRPQDASALIHRAELQLEAGSKAKALADADAALRIDTSGTSEGLHIAALYADAGEYDRAINAWDIWIKANPASGSLADALSLRCLYRGAMGRDLDQALNDCDRAVELRPGADGPLQNRGLVHVKQGEYALAIVDYDLALVDKNTALSLYGRGVAKMRQGRDYDGNTDIKAAIAKDPRVSAEARRYGLTASTLQPVPPVKMPLTAGR
jgi:tetratricopeptide (TPR) repeat protein